MTSGRSSGQLNSGGLEPNQRRVKTKEEQAKAKPAYAEASADNGGLAQLARAPALQAGGHRFDSDILHGSCRSSVRPDSYRGRYSPRKAVSRQLE